MVSLAQAPRRHHPHGHYEELGLSRSATAPTSRKRGARRARLSLAPASVVDRRGLERWRLARREFALTTPALAPRRPRRYRSRSSTAPTGTTPRMPSRCSRASRRRTTSSPTVRPRSFARPTDPSPPPLSGCVAPQIGKRRLPLEGPLRRRDSLLDPRPASVDPPPPRLLSPARRQAQGDVRPVRRVRAEGRRPRRPRR